MPAGPHIVAVHRSPKHGFSKHPQLALGLVAGLGAVGDAHMGATVQHRYDRRKNPKRPNLRQIHLIGAEFLAQLSEAGTPIRPGEMGENLTTSGLPLVHLPQGTRLHVGAQAVLELTGLRDPCVLIDRFRPGLLAEVNRRSAEAGTARQAGVMSVVLLGGLVQAGDCIRVELPPEPHQRLSVV